ncbi:MAG: YbhB/YbcL family Raf kinase inhibitor-like protein [Acidobacteriaceae bacterium]
MVITSLAFENQGKIPVEYTCNGENVSPPLLISGVPEEAQSLALILEDPDVPKSFKPDGLFVHWLAWDIPPDITELPEGIEPPGVIGQNGAGKAGYTGPCPPDREHRYFFKLFALDTLLTDARIANREDLLKAMEGHILAEAELVGKYEQIK